MLTRLDQKGMWSSPEVPNFSGAADAPPAERRDLTHTVTPAERGKPVAPPLRSRPQGKRLARGADGAAGKGGGSKRRPLGSRADRDCATRQHHPTVKAGRLPSGLPSRENLGQPTQGAKQICRRQQRLLVRLLTLQRAGTPSPGGRSGATFVGSRRVS